MSTVGREEDGGPQRPSSVSVYNIGGDLILVVHAEIAFKVFLTHDSVRLQVANVMQVPPGLLQFVAIGRETDCFVLRSDEDIRNVSDVQVVITLEKRDGYLQGGRTHLVRPELRAGGLLENFLFAEHRRGCTVRCAEVQKANNVDRQKLFMVGAIFGAILANLEDAEALDEILFLFDLQSEVIDPLVNDVLAPLEEFSGSARPDKTGSFIPVLVDWVEGLSVSIYYEMAMHLD